MAGPPAAILDCEVTLSMNAIHMNPVVTILGGHIKQRRGAGGKSWGGAAVLQSRHRDPSLDKVAFGAGSPQLSSSVFGQ